ncbi:MAG: YfhO family protein [Candidatus Hydrogenedentes bacterium]|nr:YfhO family protein [Candidatus Hydrogenedentota bacterium]
MRRWGIRGRVESLWCAAILVLAAAGALFPALTGDRIPLDLHAGHSDLGAGTVAGASNTQVYENFRYMSAPRASWRDLLWNNQQGLGLPFLAQWETRVLSPFSLPFYVLPFQPALLLSLAAKLVAAGLCAYYAARRLAFPQSFALTVGIAYEFSGLCFNAVALPVADTLVWFPLLLLNAERLARGRWRNWPITALIVVLMGLGGSLEALAASLLFSCAYIIARRVLDKPRTHPLSGSIGMGLGWLAGAGLLAIQWLPFLEWLGEKAPNATASSSLVWADAIHALVPVAFASHVDGGVIAQTYLFTGLLPLLLVALWLAVRTYAGKALRRRMEALVLAAGLLWLLPFVWTSLAALLPAGVTVDFSPATAFLPLALVFVAVSAAEVWLHLDPDQVKSALRQFLLFVVLLWPLVGIPVVWQALPTADHGLNMALLFYFGLAALGLLLVLGVTLVYPNPRFMGYALAAGLGVLLYVAQAPALPWSRVPVKVAQETTDEEAAYPARVAVSGAHNAAEAARWGIPLLIVNPAPHLLREQRFLLAAQDNPQLYQRAGIRTFILQREELSGAFAPYRGALSFAGLQHGASAVFQAPEALPPAYVIHAAEAANPVDAAALSRSRLTVLESAALPATGAPPAACATLKPGSPPTDLKIQLESTAPGILVCTEAWYPGWEAWTGDIRNPVVPVDGVFRGVEISSGTFSLVLRYNPLSLRVGLWISGIALLLVLYNLRHVHWSHSQ